MFRVLLVLLVFILGFSPLAFAQPTETLKLDDRIRIYTHAPLGKIVVGALVRVDEQVVTLISESRDPVAVPRSMIAALERSTGERSRAGRATLGVLAGVVGGVLAGARTRECRESAGTDSPCGSSFVYAHILGLVGGVAAAKTVPDETWTPVGLDLLTQLSSTPD